MPRITFNDSKRRNRINFPLVEQKVGPAIEINLSDGTGASSDSDTKQADESTQHPNIRPVARKLSDLPNSTDSDPNALLGVRRWLCKGSAGLWVGETGSGKSSGAMQAAIQWALGKPFFGIPTIKPLKSLIIQVENDDYDLAEMRDQIMDGLDLFEEQRKQVCENILIHTEDGKTGGSFLCNTLEPLLEDNRPDLTWIDPLLGVIGGDIAKQEVTSAFCRSGLNPIIRRHHTALWLIHHATKPKQDNGKGGGRENLAYYGAGSADLFNWARATMLLREQDGCFELRLEKRWQRAGWESKSKLIAQSTDGRIYWRELDKAASAQASNLMSKEDRVMSIIPASAPIGKDTLLLRIQEEKIAGANAARDIIKALLQQGRVYEWSKKRERTNPLKFIARHPQPPVWPESQEHN